MREVKKVKKAIGQKENLENKIERYNLKNVYNLIKS
jgi:hypothetical protein